MVSMRHMEEHWHPQSEVTLLPLSPQVLFCSSTWQPARICLFHTHPYLTLGPFPSALHSLQVKSIQALGLLA